MVVVPKPDGKVRICVDLTKLNENVCRERHILPSVDYTLAQPVEAKVQSKLQCKLDANSGFWQIELSKESALLTTFIIPFGQFCLNSLPLGSSQTWDVNNSSNVGHFHPDAYSKQESARAQVDLWRIDALNWIEALLG